MSRLVRSVAGAAMALFVFAAAAAGAQAAAYSSQTLHFIVHVGPGNATACNIVGALYRPKGATKQNPAPAVLTTNGFGGSYSGQEGLAANLASDGYVVLTYSGLGFGHSSCRIELDSPQWDGEAASQLITFLGGGAKATNGTRVNYVESQKKAPNGRHYKYDPRVGMIGASYGGEVQFAAAEIDPRIDAIVPIITWNNLAYSLAPNDADLIGDTLNSATPGITKEQWLADFVLLGQTGPIVAPAPASTCPNFDQVECPVIDDLTHDGYPDAASAQLASSYSVSSYMSRIRIPVMLMQGEDDTLFNLNEAVATYDALRSQHTPVKMVWQSWGHSHLASVPGELGNGLGILNSNGTMSLEGEMILDWFNHYVKGVGPAPALNFSFYRPWIRYKGDDAAAAYASAPRYPIAKGSRFYLSGAAASGTGTAAGADSLVSSRSTATAGSVALTTPAANATQSVTEEAGFSQSVPLTDPAGSYAEYESPPLTKNTYVVGIPSVTVTASAPSADLLMQPLPADLGLFVKLEDIAPDGSATLPDRLVAPARFPDTGAPVTVTLPGIVHEFRAGDRIALLIAGSDASYFQPYLNTPVTISTDPAAPGVLDLPVAASSSYTKVVLTKR
jgi:ABC-2 type transport system ATP-binding protein